MLLKWIGAALIVAGCGGTGMAMARNYRKEEQNLQQFLRILDTMTNELSCRGSALPYMIRSAAEGVFLKLFHELAEELELQLYPDAGCCMAAVMGKHPELSWNMKELLSELGQTLGSFDLDGQLRDLEALRQKCGRILEEHRSKRDKRIMSYQTLGICAGAALAILFI